jgi:hypothetical protein
MQVLDFYLFWGFFDFACDFGNVQKCKSE